MIVITVIVVIIGFALFRWNAQYTLISKLEKYTLNASPSHHWHLPVNLPMLRNCCMPKSGWTDGRSSITHEWRMSWNRCFHNFHYQTNKCHFFKCVSFFAAENGNFPKIFDIFFMMLKYLNVQKKVHRHDAHDEIYAKFGFDHFFHNSFICLNFSISNKRNAKLANECRKDFFWVGNSESERNEWQKKLTWNFDKICNSFYW